MTENDLKSSEIYIKQRLKVLTEKLLNEKLERIILEMVEDK